MAGTNATSLKALFQGLAGDGAQVLQGVVQSASPLKIQVAGDAKLTVGPHNVYLPRHLTDYDTEVTIEWETEEAAGHKHAVEGRKKIRVHNALKTGEKVYLLAFNHGKQYYVLDRVV